MSKKIPWGTVIVFGIGISLGTVLLETTAAQWLSDKTFSLMGLNHIPLIAIIALISLFNILIHLGFAVQQSLFSTDSCIYRINTNARFRRSVDWFRINQQFVISLVLITSEFTTKYARIWYRAFTVRFY